VRGRTGPGLGDEGTVSKEADEDAGVKGSFVMYKC